MNTVVYMLNLFMQLMVATFLFEQVGESKKGFLHTLFVLYTVMIGEYFFFKALGESAPGNTMQTVIRLFIMAAILVASYRGKLLTRLRPLFIYFFIALVCEVSTIVFVGYIFDMNKGDFYNVNINSVYISAGKIIIADLMMLLAMLLVVILTFKQLVTRNNIQDILIITGFTVAHLAFLLIYYRVNRADLFEMNNFIQLAFQALLFSMLFIQYYNTLRTRKLMESERELQILKSEMDNNYRYYKLADSKFDEISKLRHDIQNHLTTARHLMSTPDGNEQARNIMDNIQEQLNSVRVVNYCDNKTLNAVMTVKLNEERVSKIDTQIIMQDCSVPDIDDYDLCSLVTNMFDNAVESCLRTERPENSFIEIKSAVQNEFFVLRITNSCEDKDVGKSRKGQGHGYGLKIAEGICKKYGGEFSLKREGNVVVSSAFLKK